MEKTRKFAVNRGEFFESTGKESFCRNVTPVPSVTNVYYFFMNCHDAGRFVRCGFVYVIVCYGAAFMYAAAQLCGRAYVVPSTRAAAHLYVSGHPWCRGRVCCRASL